MEGTQTRKASVSSGVRADRVACGVQVSQRGVAPDYSGRVTAELAGDLKLPTRPASVAELVELCPVQQKVAGTIPSPGTCLVMAWSSGGVQEAAN